MVSNCALRCPGGHIPISVRLDKDVQMVLKQRSFVLNGHFRQMVNVAIIFKSFSNGFNYGTIFKIHACINWNYIEYIIMIA